MTHFKIYRCLIIISILLFGCTSTTLNIENISEIDSSIKYEIKPMAKELDIKDSTNYLYDIVYDTLGSIRFNSELDKLTGLLQFPEHPEVCGFKFEGFRINNSDSFQLINFDIDDTNNSVFLIFDKPKKRVRLNTKWHITPCSRFIHLDDYLFELK